MAAPTHFQMTSIGVISSPYKEKFAIPRQPGLVSSAKATLTLTPPYDEPDALRGLAEFSHVWLVFAFHETMDKGWNPTVRPPRLGGNERLGVFATRSTFRPNPIGLSVAKLEGITTRNNQCQLHLSGIDLVDGTPILDIKPYIPYADNVPDAQGSYANESPDANMKLTFKHMCSMTLHSNKNVTQSCKSLSLRCSLKILVPLIKKQNSPSKLMA